jgi:type VI protein secretion system component VasF
MNSDLATVVDRVVLCGLDLKERLDRGDHPDISVEQAQLRTLLKGESESRRWPDYGGDNPLSGTTIGGERAQVFQGSRYALVCWLDEMFTLDPQWAEKWQEEALEPQLYRSRLRADLFWEHARRAEGRPSTDALEGFFLCAVLGFRGKYAGAPEKVQAWCDMVEPRITAGFDRGYDLPSAKMPPCNVPPLTAREQLRKLVAFGALLGGVFLLLAAFLLVAGRH